MGLDRSQGGAVDRILATVAIFVAFLALVVFVARQSCSMLVEVWRGE